MTELVLLLLAALALAAVVVTFRATQAARLAATRQTYRLDFPRGLAPEAVVRALVGLSGLGQVPKRSWFSMEALVFETVADARGITHRLTLPAPLRETVIGQLRAACPSLRLTGPEAVPAQAGWSLARELRLRRSMVLATAQPEAVSGALLGALSPLTGDERLAVQWVVRPDVPRPPLASVLPDWRPWWRPPTPEQVKADRQSHERKLSEPLFLAAGRLGVRADTVARSRSLMRRLLGAYFVLNAPGSCLAVRPVPSGWSARRLLHRSVPLLTWPILCNAAELACLLGWPVGDVQVPGLSLGGCRQLAPSALIPEHGRVIGRATYPGSDRLLALSPRDRLQHLWVLGPTGSGKSTLLLNLITQDMAAGTGVVLLDPMGDLTEQCLDRVPPERVGDVIVLDATDDDRPVGLNPLGSVGRDADLVTDQVVGIFRHLYAAFWGPRSDDVLRGAIGTLVRQPEPYTLCEVPRLLTDADWRRRLVGALDDPIGLEAFWGWYEALSQGERTAAIGPVLNKLRALIVRRRIRQVIGQAEGLDLAQVLAEGKLLFVPLRKGVLGDETAALLGALVLARLWQATQGRAGLPASARPPVMAYLDEFQDYLALPTSVATVLAQSRGLGVGLTLAHQHLGQLPREVRAAVLANARSKVVFQVAADDARTLAREFAPYLEPPDLQGLGPYEVALQLVSDGQVAPPATGVTLPPPPTTGQAQAVREHSHRTFGMAAAVVEAAIRQRHSPSSPAAPIGRTRRQP